MDTDLDLVNLAVEQEVLTRKAGTSKQKSVEEWTQERGCQNMLRCIIMAVLHLDGNSL